MWKKNRQRDGEGEGRENDSERGSEKEIKEREEGRIK